MPVYVRFQSAVPNRRGAFPGVFALANGLAGDGRLSAEDLRLWRAMNDRMNTAYADPTASDPDCYDRRLHPGARSGIKVGPADRLLEGTRFYTDLLDRYGVPWVELRTGTPGHVHFEDDVHVVATPFLHESDWPFRP